MLRSLRSRRPRRWIRDATKSSSWTRPSIANVEELGGMNVFFVFDDGSLVTPPLSGTILPGITRDCDHHARPQGRPHGARGALQHRAMARRRGQRQAARGLRLRHRRGDLGDRPDQSTKGDIVIGDGNGGTLTAGLRAQARRHPARRCRRHRRLIRKVGGDRTNGAWHYSGTVSPSAFITAACRSTSGGGP